MKPVDQSSFESLNSEVIYFLLCAVFWTVESISPGAIMANGFHF